MKTDRIVSILQSPVSVFAFIGGGVLFGIKYPDLSRDLAPLGQTYLSLLKMVVLPFIVSSIIFSVRALIRDPGSSKYLLRIVAAILLVSFMSVAVGGTLALTLKPGEIQDQQTRLEFGKLVARDNGVATDLQMTLAEPSKAPDAHSPFAYVVELVPSNIFNALASGDTLKVLLFSILFGIAVGHVPHTVSASLADTLDTVYRACIVLTRWFNVLLPFASFAMIAEQVSNLGPQSLLVMLDYLRVMGIATLVFVSASLIIVSFATGMSIWRVFREHQNVFMMAIATRSSVACIPVMIELLSERLQFRRTVVELMVPLQTALLRAGPIMVYVIGTLFIAQLYGRDLRPEELVLLGLSSVLLGLTTAGMSGIVIISQMSILCGYFAIPFEAAFVLFIAVEAVSDTFRTLTLVSTITAATAAVSPLDPRADPIEDLDFDLVSRPAA